MKELDSYKISYASLAKEMEVSAKTVKDYMD